MANIVIIMNSVNDIQVHAKYFTKDKIY